MAVLDTIFSLSGYVALPLLMLRLMLAFPPDPIPTIYPDQE